MSADWRYSFMARGLVPEGNQAKLEEFSKTRDPALRNNIAIENQNLVWSTIQPYTSAIATIEDMFQAGMMGLLVAIDRFDPTVGVKLSTYAVPWIKKEVRSLIDNPAYIDDIEGFTPEDDYVKDDFSESVSSMLCKLLTPVELSVLEIAHNVDSNYDDSINVIGKLIGVPSSEVRASYKSGIEKINKP
jgi:RNA polymerase sporulation-specific sigma factor